MNFPSRDYGRDSISCDNCGCGGQTREGTYSCQGAVPDACTRRACETCKQGCELCGLPVCAAHSTEFEGHPTCHNCLVALHNDGELLADQYTAETLALLAAAGCTVNEARAVSQRDSGSTQ